MRGLLDWLLRPRSVRVVGRRRPADKLQFNKRLAKARGAVELVVVAGARCAPATVNKAAAAARAVVVLPSSGTDACALTDCEAAVLGPGSGLWSPSLAAGVETQGRRGRERRPVLVVTTTRAAASQALRAAQVRGAPGPVDRGAADEDQLVYVVASQIGGGHAVGGLHLDRRGVGSLLAITCC